MNFIKNNKFSIFAMVTFTLIVLICSYCYNIFFVNGKGAIYGDRLEGIEDVSISSDTTDKLIDELTSRDDVKKVTYALHGKIVNVIITVTDNVNKSSAKAIGALVLNYFSEDELGYYDFQVYVQKEDESLTDFPIIGYKQNLEKGFSWSKDR